MRPDVGAATSSEDETAHAELCAPLGQPGSGRLRYAAAMHLYGLDQVSDAALEVYRICSPLDGEDPAALLRMRGLAHEVSVPQQLSGDLAIRMLVDAADRYFASLSGPGIAEIRADLSVWRSGPVTPGLAPASAFVQRWMPEALAALRATHPALAAAISAAVPHLKWITYDGYPVAEVGEAFSKGHAFASIIGEDAAIPAVDWECGIFLISPHVLYRDHRHIAPELYAPLTGPHGWRFETERPLKILPAHQPVWNDPFVTHLTKVGPIPFLSFYAWTKDVNPIAEIVPASDWAMLEALRLGR